MDWVCVCVEHLAENAGSGAVDRGKGRLYRDAKELLEVVR